MACMACGSSGDFRCTIKELSVCLCPRHMEEGARYDSVVAKLAL